MFKLCARCMATFRSKSRRSLTSGGMKNTFQLSKILAEEHETKLAASPDKLKEYEKFKKFEKILDEKVFNQLEKPRSIDELDESFQIDDPIEREEQKEFEFKMFQRDMIKDPENKEPDINEMETGEETTAKPINRFRKILYTEGELDGSDLSKPPSTSNPHPFDPSDPETCPMPPIHSRSLAALANFLPTLQLLIVLGVDLFKAHHQDPRLGQVLIKLDSQKELMPKIYWLCKRAGVPAAELGSYLTRNPYFLFQKMDHLRSHLSYLKYRRFTTAQMTKLIVEYRYWLNQPIELIDSRLGWIQRQFKMKPDELRVAILKEPKLIAFGTGPIQGILRCLNDECGFDQRQLKLILIRDPRLFLCNRLNIRVSYNYLAFVMRVQNKQLVEFPAAMRCPIGGLRQRHEYLFRLRKANYEPDTPDYICLKECLHPSDRHFAENVAKTPIEDYDRFLRYI